MELQDTPKRKKSSRRRWSLVRRRWSRSRWTMWTAPPGTEGYARDPQSRHRARGRPVKVRGKAKYTYDVRLPGMLYGKMLLPPHANAEIVRIDTSAAEKIPGVKTVLLMPDKSRSSSGDPVAAVAATTPEIAEDAIRAIQVEYKPLPS